MSRPGTVFTDYLHVTVPYELSGGLREAVLEACGHDGVDERPGAPGVYDMYAGGGGTMLVLRRGPVVIVGLSGSTIKVMRDLKVFNDVLWVFADYPHKVTHLDAAYDIAIEAPPVLDGLFEEFKATGVRLGKRPAPVSKTGWKIGLSGAETGTIYIGGRQAEIRARVYDKRQEQVDRKFSDPGPMLRYELVLTNKAAAMSLRDAADPTELFWHFIGGRLLPRPPGVAPWVPGGVGFDLPRRRAVEPSERLERFVSDNATLRRGLVLADACGPRGREYMWSLMKKLPTSELAGGGPSS